MNFNPDPSKQAQEVLFSRKLHKFLHRFLTMQAFHKQILQNIWEWYQIPNLNDHLDIAFTKVRKIVGLSGKLSSNLPRAALVTIFKAFDRLYLDYGGVQHDQAFTSVFHEKLESFSAMHVQP